MLAVIPKYRKQILIYGAGFLAFLILLAGIGLWRLSMGPVSVGFLASRIEAAINTRVQPWEASVGSVQLAWDTRDNRLFLSVSDIRLSPPDAGEQGRVAVISSLDAAFTPGWGLVLLQPEINQFSAVVSKFVPGDFASQIPALKGIHMTVSGRMAVDFSSGEILAGDAQFSAVGDITDSPFLAPVSDGQAQLTASYDPESSNIHLKELLLRGEGRETVLSGSVGFADNFPALKRLDMTLRNMALANPDPNGTPLLVDARLAADINAVARSAHIEELSVSAGDGRLMVSGDAVDAPGSPALDLTGGISRLSVEDLIRLWPPSLAPGAWEWVFRNVSSGTISDGQFRMKVEGGDLADTGPGKSLPDEKMSLKFNLNNGAFHYLSPMPPMQDVSARAHLQGDRFDIRVDAAKISLPSGVIDVSDARFQTAGFSLKGSPGDVNLHFASSMESMLSLIGGEPLEALKNVDVNPADVGGGVMGELMLSLPLNKDVKLEEVTLAVEGNVAGLRGPLPGTAWQVTGGDPGFLVDNSGFTITGPVDVNNIPVTVEWRQQFNSGAIDVDVSALAGSTELERLGLSGGIGINPDKDFSQDARIQLTLHSPDGQLSDGTLSADLTDPVLTFPVVGLVKPANSPAQLKMDLLFDPDGEIHLRNLLLTGNMVNLRGKVIFDDDGELQAMTMQADQLGVDNSFNVNVESDPDDALIWKVEGQRVDARAIITDLLGGKSDAPGESDVVADETFEEIPEESLGKKVIMEGRFDDVVAYGGIFLSDVRVSAEEIDDSLARLEVSGKFSDEAELTVSLAPPEQSGEQTDQQTGSGRTLRVDADDGGAFVRALDLYDNIRGGTISIAAHAGPVGGPVDGPVDGNVMLEGEISGGEFRVVDAPVFAELLTLGSLTGIRDTLQGSGIFFRKLKMPFRMDNTTIHIQNASMVGPAMGITMNGVIDRASGIAEINGTISPAYTLNSILTSIPLIGQLFGGEEGEGTFGITYQVSGHLDDPSIATNPLSLFAPGVFRKLFGFSEGDAEANESERDEN